VPLGGLGDRMSTIERGKELRGGPPGGGWNLRTFRGLEDLDWGDVASTFSRRCGNSQLREETSGLWQRRGDHPLSGGRR